MEEEVRTNRKTGRGIAYALLSALAFGLLIPFAKMCLEGIAPLQLGALLLLGAGVGTGCILLVRAALGKGSAEASIGKADAPKLVSVALLNAIAVAFLVYGLYRTVAANASLLMCFEIAAATVFAWVLLKRHVCYKACAAVGLIVVASILLCWDVVNFVFVPESLLIVVACAIRGFEGTVKKSFAKKDPLQIACIRSFGAGIVLLVASIAVDGVPAIELPFAGEALLLGFLTFGLGATMHLAAQRDLGSARAEGYFALAPFIGMLISWSNFGFALEPLFFGALALMALGVWLAMDDSVFHEDAFAALDQERMMMYTGEALPYDFDRMHRPLSQ